MFLRVLRHAVGLRRCEVVIEETSDICSPKPLRLTVFAPVVPRGNQGQKPLTENTFIHVTYPSVCRLATQEAHYARSPDAKCDKMLSMCVKAKFPPRQHAQSPAGRSPSSAAFAQRSRRSSQEQDICSATSSLQMTYTLPRNPHSALRFSKLHKHMAMSEA